MSVQRARFETTSTEFVEWIVYLDNEELKYQKMDYYLAQIACEVRRSFVKDSKSIKITDFLLKFLNKKKKVETRKLSIKERTKRAKAYWRAVLGMTSIKKKRKR